MICAVQWSKSSRILTRPLPKAFQKCGCAQCKCRASFKQPGPIRVLNLHKSDKNRITDGNNVWLSENNEWGMNFFRLALTWSKLVILLGFECCTPHHTEPNQTAPHHTTRTHKFMISFDGVTTYGSAASLSIVPEHIRPFAGLLSRSLSRMLVTFGDVWLKIYIDRLPPMWVYLSNENIPRLCFALSSPLAFALSLPNLRSFYSFFCPSLGTTPLLHHILLNTRTKHSDNAKWFLSVH